MSIIDALLLGLIQGLTEFIPVSSSGHLLLFDALRGGDVSFEFETLTNIGTLLAATVYFREDILKLFSSSKDKIASNSTMLFAIAPVLLAGLIISLLDLDLFQSVGLAVSMLIIVGIIMMFEQWAPITKTEQPLSKRDGLTIGLLQILALIPGTSRSAITILAGRARGLSLELAARFSFILSIPVVAAAVGLTFIVAVQDGQSLPIGALVAANVASFVSAIAAIHFLLSLLKKYNLFYFGMYRIIVGVVLLLLL